MKRNPFLLCNIYQKKWNSILWIYIFLDNSAYDNLSELNNDSTAWLLLYYIGLILCERRDY